jgi:hypothetical protein
MLAAPAGGFAASSSFGGRLHSVRQASGIALPAVWRWFVEASSIKRNAAFCPAEADHLVPFHGERFGAYLLTNRKNGQAKCY